MGAIADRHGPRGRNGARSRQTRCMRKIPRRRPDRTSRHLTDLGLPDADRLAAVGTPLDLAAGTTLVRQGERGTQAFLLLDGTAQVLTSEGVVTVGPGAVVGERATLDHRCTRNATVIAQTDVSVLVYDARTYRGLVDSEALRPHLAPTR